MTSVTILLPWDMISIVFKSSRMRLVVASPTAGGDSRAAGYELVRCVDSVFAFVLREAVCPLVSEGFEGWPQVGNSHGNDDEDSSSFGLASVNVWT